MALPTFYTDETLAAFMRDQLKNLVADLGWQAEPFTEPINDVLIACGVNDLSLATDIPKVRALARIAAWKAAEQATAGDYDTQNKSDEAKRSQVHAHAIKQRVAAETSYQTLLNDRATEANAEAEALRLNMQSSSSVYIENVL